MFGRISDWLDQLRLPAVTLHRSHIYALLDTLSAENEVYRRAGAVHGCALCGFNPAGEPRIDLFVEDVGRHNAADAIYGHVYDSAASTAPTRSSTTPPVG